MAAEKALVDSDGMVKCGKQILCPSCRKETPLCANQVIERHGDSGLVAETLFHCFKCGSKWNTENPVIVDDLTRYYLAPVPKETSGLLGLAGL